MTRPVLLLLWSLLSAGTTCAALAADAYERLFEAQSAMAQKGDRDAQYHLGEMHELGLGTSPSLEQAYLWYARAAEKGHPLAAKKLEEREKVEADARAASARSAALARERAALQEVEAEKRRAETEVQNATNTEQRAQAQARLTETERRRTEAESRAAELTNDQARAEAAELARKRAAFEAAMARQKALPLSPFE